MPSKKEKEAGKITDLYLSHGPGPNETLDGVYVDDIAIEIVTA